MEFTKGDTYTGSWQNGNMQGNGTLRMKNGNEVTGFFEDGKLKGKGPLDKSLEMLMKPFAKGIPFAGSRPNGDTYGNGIFKKENGAEFYGFFVDGKVEGSMIEAGGNQKIRKSKNTKSGEDGVITFADGSTYEGGFKDGQRHGAGVFKNNDGMTEEQMWKDGTRFS
eukprot:TRINITY_DN75709_c0_g1_i1.p1 TRINITY_DN75709_c0_g1~~TRINITY_DN75709_c0_g1_i1.p1  ORF type:complete len:166 (-),score=37.11 TRINITY_DN75709_c0_g1_i1:175-672(-)